MFKRSGKKKNTVLQWKSTQYSYEETRAILNALIDKIAAQNSQGFPDREQVFDVFAQAKLSGRILELGRLTDSTFGAGTFRKIGELDHDLPALKRFIEKLGKPE